MNDIAKFLGSAAGFVSDPVIIGGFVIAMAIVLLWRDPRSATTACAVLALCCIGVGVNSLFAAAYMHSSEVLRMNADAALSYSNNRIIRNGLPIPLGLSALTLIIIWRFRKLEMIWLLIPLLALILAGFYGNLLSGYYSARPSPVAAETTPAGIDGQMFANDSPGNGWTQFLQRHVETQCIDVFLKNNPKFPKNRTAAYCRCLLESVYPKWSYEDFAKNEASISSHLASSGVAAECQIRAFQQSR